jgi:hypothetical protein
MVGQMKLEQHQSLVDLLGQANLLHQLVDQAQAAISRPHAAARQFILHVARAQHRLFLTVGRIVELVQPPRESKLASPHSISDTLLHSKLLLFLVAHG